MQQLAIIDFDLLETRPQQLAEALRSACTNMGFFYVKNHGISEKLQDKLESISKLFFALNIEQKEKINMEKGGRAWRGYFPVMGELTSGKADLKEGLYFGEELARDHEKVIQNIILHGANLFPEELPEMKQIVLEYMQEMSLLSQRIMRGLALSLDLNSNYFLEHFTKDPLQLFRIFHYPPSNTVDNEIWGVGEHTDYGLITILKQDKVGGLQVKSKGIWVEAPPIENTFVCNIGDMLDYLTDGLYVSTPHRVKNKTQEERYSFPYFFDPNFDAPIVKIDLRHLEIKKKAKSPRWDKENLHNFQGTYGDYINKKIGKVFPKLK